MIETPYAKVENGKVTSEIHYLNAAEEEKQRIAHGAINTNEDGSIAEEMVESVSTAHRPAYTKGKCHI